MIMRCVGLQRVPGKYGCAEALQYDHFPIPKDDYVRRDRCTLSDFDPPYV